MARRRGKHITPNAMIGAKGVNLIERIVLEMGCFWYPTGGVEAGIDGYIEFRDAQSGRVFNLVLQVQSKATEQAFSAETPTSFEYLCDEDDLDYWLSGNAPVILVRSRPRTGEAYWVSISDYFRDPAARQSRKIRFDKTKDRFDAQARDALFALAAPQTKGLYLTAPPRRETLWANLLPVAQYGQQLFIADTHLRRAHEVWDAFRGLDPHPGREWLLKNKRLISFHDLSQEPWMRVCDRGTVEAFGADEWANADDTERRNEFTWLLNEALREKLRPLCRYDRERDYFFVHPSPALSPRSFSYRSLNKPSHLTVFQGYRDKNDLNHVWYYRHAAFAGRFLRFDGAWYLEITPTQHYTVDGRTTHPVIGDLTKGRKLLEQNRGVLSQVLMWADVLTRPPDLFAPAYPFLAFGPLLTFTLETGLEDAQWAGREPDEPPAHEWTDGKRGLFFGFQAAEAAEADDGSEL